MLQITIPKREFYNQETEEFMTTSERTIQLEHSLVSISKWESKWKKSFLSSDDKTPAESVDYIRCMTLTQNVDPSVYYGVTRKILNEVDEYIGDSMTATTFGKNHGRPSREIVTSELIYYWMVLYGIPFECQKWHLNRLTTLIRICGIKDSPQKKMSKRDIMSQNQSMNAARRQRFNSKG